MIATVLFFCVMWFVVGILVGFGLCRWCIRRADRRLDAVRG